MEETSFFDQIPDRILLEIFKLLDLKSLATARLVSSRFYDVITTNSKYLPKPMKAFRILAIKDDQDNPTVEFHCNDSEIYTVCCSATEITAKPPFYINYGVNLQKNRHYSRIWKKEQAFRNVFSRTLGDGGEFDESHPLPSVSLQGAFEEVLDFYLSHFHLNGLGLSEDERLFTPDELNLLWTRIKANKTKISCISMNTDILDDMLIDTIRRTKCSGFTLYAYFESPRREISPEDENTVEKRITELPCETLCIYENGLVSVEKILELIQQWANGVRSIERYNIHHSEMGLDWFPGVSNLRNVEVISEPEDIIWNMNATIHLKTFPISRKSDGERLDFHYWDNYIEISHYKPYVASPRSSDNEDEDEDYGFGLFD